MVILNMPPSHIVFSLPGIPHSQTLRSITPFLSLVGRAQKPNGWSFLHCFLVRRNVSPAPMRDTNRVRGCVGAGNIPLFGEAHLTESHIVGRTWDRVSVCVGRGGGGRRMKNGGHEERSGRRVEYRCRQRMNRWERSLRPVVGCLATGLEIGMDMVKPSSAW